MLRRRQWWPCPAARRPERRKARGMSELWSNAGLTTINALFRQACNQRPDRLYLDFAGETYTYRQFDLEVGRLATGLKALGVERGDRLCSVLENSPDAVFVWFAVN